MPVMLMACTTKGHTSEREPFRTAAVKVNLAFYGMFDHPDARPREQLNSVLIPCMGHGLRFSCIATAHWHAGPCADL